MAQGLSDVDICSLALRLIGSRPFQTFQDQTPQALLLNSIYPLVRDSLLRGFRWKFAIKRVGLAQLANISVYQFRQTRLELPTGRFLFALPTDYLSMVETDQDPSPYKIESVVTNVATNAQQLVVISDNAVLGIRYISRITDTSLYDPNFVSALVANLAKEIALPETGDLKKVEMAERYFQLKIAEARLLGSFEDSQDTLVATYFTTDTR